jgi:hypothetical protein
LLAATVVTVIPVALLSAGQPQPSHPTQGEGIVIELENAFIKKYMDRATIDSDFEPIGMSADHRISKGGEDGEVHIGGIAREAKLATVAEVMNVATLGKQAKAVFKKAIAQKQPVRVSGAWRLWCEHSGGRPQRQSESLQPPLPGPAKSNPDHVFEIHPVTSVRLGNEAAVSGLDAITATSGYTAYDATLAFHLGYDRLTCTITPLANNRTRIVTHAIGYNFVEFLIRLNPAEGHPNSLEIEDGHLGMATVFDTDGELVSHRRRMVFIKGTDADDALVGLAAGKRLRVVGIPRISLKLVNWRLDHKDDKDAEGHPLNPLRWNLPYEMIIVSAVPVNGDDD